MIYYARLAIVRGRLSIKTRKLTGTHTQGIESEITHGPDCTEIKSENPRIIERFIAVWKADNEHLAQNGLLTPLDVKNSYIAKVSPDSPETPKRAALVALAKELKASGKLA